MDQTHMVASTGSSFDLIPVLSCQKQKKTVLTSVSSFQTLAHLRPLFAVGVAESSETQVLRSVHIHIVLVYPTKFQPSSYSVCRML